MLARREAIEILLADRGDIAIVTGLGSTTYDVASVGDHGRNYYLWGAMGSAITVGLGLALARPDLDVVVVTGDGEMLMGIGGLATVGVKSPPNLTTVIFDNGHYGETGMQRSHAGSTCDLSGVARACGISDARVVAAVRVALERKGADRRVEAGVGGISQRLEANGRGMITKYVGPERPGADRDVA